MHQQILEQYTLVDDEMDVKDVNDFIKSYDTHTYDPIDFAVVNHYSSHCHNFITDDSDFQSDVNITVYSYQ